jgi:hypothetical protein
MLGIRFTPTPPFSMAPQDERGAEGGSGPDGGGAAADAAAVTDGAISGQNSAAARGGEPRGADAAAPAPKIAADTWRHDMAAGDKAFLKTLDRFENPAALAKAYKELTVKLSSGELRATKPPADSATPDQIAAWRTDHGLPENAAAYVNGLSLPNGTLPGEPDQPMLASFAEQAMKGNWTAEQYNQAVGWYFASQDRLMAQRQLADATFKEQASSTLTREWGTDYTANRNAVVQFFDRNFPEEFKVNLLNARLPDGSLLANQPGFNKAILEVAKVISPGGSVLPNTSGAGLSTVESRIAEIEGKYMRATHGSDPWKTYWTGEPGARMQQEYRGLLAAREQGRRSRNG